MGDNKSDELQNVIDESKRTEAKWVPDAVREHLLKSKTDLFGRLRNEPVDIMKKIKFKK